MNQCTKIQAILKHTIGKRERTEARETKKVYRNLVIAWKKSNIWVVDFQVGLENVKRIESPLKDTVVKLPKLRERYNGPGKDRPLVPVRLNSTNKTSYIL